MNRLSQNSIFQTMTRLAAPLPTWADYEAAGADRKTEIRRQWRNANTDAAVRLCIRAGRLETDACVAAHDAKIGAWAQRRFAWIKQNMPGLLNRPLGGYRNLDWDDTKYDARDIAVSAANGETTMVTPKQASI